MPSFTLRHIRRLTDSVGMLQHATFKVPNYHEGYTTDDNARALALALAARRQGLGDPGELERLATRYLAFLNFAFDEASGRFRNFLAYDRRWLERVGAENAHARALRVLAQALGEDETPIDLSHARIAHQLFDKALPAAAVFTSPRAWALTLLGLSSALRRREDAEWRRLAERLCARLLERYRRERRRDWCWFEEYLSYSNAKLAHALIAYGGDHGRADALEVGLEALEWLAGVQRDEQGRFLPVGSDRVYRRGDPRPLFDQQPIEALATVDACLTAYAASGDPRWSERARSAYRWFLGDNHLSLPLYDAASGGCRDGVHPESLNENQGAESTLAFWLSHLAMHGAGQVRPEVRARAPLEARVRL